ncbi:MAG TPA: nuclear transport factor 2 family protein [Candidatus Angelobacter sp.]|jgi:ketosteroid isomerase-like protein
MVSPNLHPALTKVDVESAVYAYWRALSAKDVIQQQNFYDDQAGIFGTDSSKLERARLVLLRRQREYLSAATKTTVQVGEIEVEVIGGSHAVAAYTIRLDAKHVTRTAAGSSTDEHLNNARVTHIFHRQSDGALRIVHEHISVPLVP